MPLDAPTIMAMNRTLAHAIKNEQQINTVAENVQSSELTFLEALYHMAHGELKPDQNLFFALQVMQLLLEKWVIKSMSPILFKIPKKS